MYNDVIVGYSSASMIYGNVYETREQGTGIVVAVRSDKSVGTGFIIGH
jgi:hypothetical protein